jgi:hypothetical protein
VKTGINGVAPGFRAEGLSVLVLGEGKGLNQSLAEIGHSHRSFGFDLTASDGAEESS